MVMVENARVPKTRERLQHGHNSLPVVHQLDTDSAKTLFP